MSESARGTTPSIQERGEDKDCHPTGENEEGPEDTQRKNTREEGYKRMRKHKRHKKQKRGLKKQEKKDGKRK